MPDSTYNCVALDLDGTLLNSKHQVTTETKRVLQDLIKSNVGLIIATGRSAGSVTSVAQELDLQMDIPLVCVNGTVGKRIASYGVRDDAACNNAVEHSKIFYVPVSKSATKKTFALAKRLGICLQYYANDVIYANPVTDLDFQAVEQYKVMTGTEQVLVEDDFAEVLSRTLPSKLLIMAGAERVEAVEKAAHGELGLECHLIHGTPAFFVEVLDKKANKGNGWWFYGGCTYGVRWSLHKM